jgi:acyl dehydratase
MKIARRSIGRCGLFCTAKRSVREFPPSRGLREAKYDDAGWLWQAMSTQWQRIMKYFEDFAVGTEFESRTTYKITAEEIKSFARKWDPWPYHLDEERARDTLIGQLFAPSALTFCVSVKLAHETAYYEASTVAGLGIDELRMPKPVLPGDELRVKLTIMDKRASKSRPGTGVITTKTEVLGQHGEVVLAYQLAALVNKRPS